MKTLNSFVYEKANISNSQVFHMTNSYYNCYHPIATSPQKYLPVPLIQVNQEWNIWEKSIQAALQNQDFYLHEDRLLQGGSNAQLKVSKASQTGFGCFSHITLWQNGVSFIFLWVSTVSSNICKGEWKNGWMDFLILTNEGLSINAYQVDLYLLFPQLIKFLFG